MKFKIMKGFNCKIFKNKVKIEEKINISCGIHFFKLIRYQIFNKLKVITDFNLDLA